MQLFNLKVHKEKRRTLRKKMTPTEVALWRELRNEKIGYKFRRQFGVGRYILDFYCPKLKFAIELDGETHTSEIAQKNDMVRDEFLNDCGITVKRFWNHEVYEDINSVLEVIVYLCHQKTDCNSKSQPSHPESPSKIRGRYRGS